MAFSFSKMKMCLPGVPSVSIIVRQFPGYLLAFSATRSASFLAAWPQSRYPSPAGCIVLIGREATTTSARKVFPSMQTDRSGCCSPTLGSNVGFIRRMVQTSNIKSSWRIASTPPASALWSRLQTRLGTGRWRSARSRKTRDSTADVHVLVTIHFAQSDNQPGEYEFLTDFKLVVFDEAHRSIAPTFTSVMQEIGTCRSELAHSHLHDIG